MPAARTLSLNSSVTCGTRRSCRSPLLSTPSNSPMSRNTGTRVARVNQPTEPRARPATSSAAMTAPIPSSSDQPSVRSDLSGTAAACRTHLDVREPISLTGLLLDYSTGRRTPWLRGRTYRRRHWHIDAATARAAVESTCARRRGYRAEDPERPLNRVRVGTTDASRPDQDESDQRPDHVPVAALERQPDAEGHHRGPEVQQQHGPAVAVPELEQAVVQVLLVRRERRPSAAYPPDHRQQQVDERQREHGQRTSSGRYERQEAPRAPLNACGSVVVVADVAAADSIRPSTIEPESPMNIRAGTKLCGRKPRTPRRGPPRAAWAPR